MQRLATKSPNSVKSPNMTWTCRKRRTLYQESIGYFEKLGSPVAGQVKGMLEAVLQRMAAPNRSA